jgi:hypothetical protein
MLSSEQRAAPSFTGVSLTLCGPPEALALRVVESSDTEPSVRAPSPVQRVVNVLSEVSEPMRLTSLRKQCRMRTQSLSAALDTLLADGKIEKTPKGYHLVTQTETGSFPASI